MTVVEHQLRLSNEDRLGRRAVPEPVGGLVHDVPRLVKQSIRMAFEGRASKKGKIPGWLKRAADVRFVDVSGDDETILHFECPILGEAAEVLYRQHEMWDSRPDGDDTGFDLLGDVLRDVHRGNRQSDRFDDRLLRNVRRLGRALDGPYDALSLGGHRLASDPAVCDGTTIANARRMAESTPPPNRVRVVGLLDMIRASTETFAIKLDTGEEVRGVVAGRDVSDLPELFRQRVLVLGDAVYRPTGSLLRIDADRVTAANGEPALWSRMPKPTTSGIDPHSLRKLQTKTTGLNAIIGKWPGDETDEEFAEALSELS